MSRLVVSFCGATEMQGKASQSEGQFYLHNICSTGQAVLEALAPYVMMQSRQFVMNNFDDLLGVEGIFQEVNLTLAG